MKKTMKPILLSSKSGHQDLLTYGKDLFDKITTEYHGIAYTQFKPDFSDVPELCDDDEKIVLFNHFAIPDGFKSLTEHLPKFKNVKFVLSPYSTYAGLDLNVVKELGIRYRNNSGANAKSVAQYAITCAFSLLSRFPELSKLSSLPDGSILGEEYHNKTAGIVGMGNVGKELLETLTKLNVKTVFYNRTSKDMDAKQVTLEEVFRQDMIFIAIATNPDTKALLSQIKTLINKKNYLIDVSAYDDLYDKKGVVNLLNSGKMKGYALETDAELESDKNFIATPHIAWCTVDAERRTVENYLNRALLILQGEESKVDFIV